VPAAVAAVAAEAGCCDGADEGTGASGEVGRLLIDSIDSLDEVGRLLIDSIDSLDEVGRL
jgi:hypothetical protein